jgi:hypothetical protein
MKFSDLAITVCIPKPLAWLPPAPTALLALGAVDLPKSSWLVRLVENWDELC